MVERELVPFLRTRFSVRPPGSTLTLRFVGLGQSQISQTLQDHMKLPPGLVMTSQFDSGRVDFTFALPGQAEADKQWLAELGRTMRNLLGDNLYADDDSTLEAQTLRAFARRGLTLALIEIGSGGHIASSLAGTIGFDRVLLGSIVAPSEASLRQILGVGDSTATGGPRESAHAARDRCRADVIVIIELQGLVPGESGNVRVTWVDGGYRETQFPGTDASPGSRAVLTTRVIDWLRRQVEIK
jgi:nicotinamide-nucleotide amidase